MILLNINYLSNTYQCLPYFGEEQMSHHHQGEFELGKEALVIKNYPK